MDLDSLEKYWKITNGTLTETNAKFFTEESSVGRYMMGIYSMIW